MGTGDAPPEPSPADRAAVVYSSDYEIDMWGLELGPTFDLHKHFQIAQALVRDGYLEPDDFITPAEATREELLRVHTSEYLERLGHARHIAEYLDQRPLMLIPAATLDQRVLRTFRFAVGGTVAAARLALKRGFAVNLGGGYAHAHPDRGQGACVYADVPVAVRTLQAEGRLRRVLVVDCNVYQGNGLAACFASDEDVVTFSLHEADLWPKDKRPSTLDVALPLPVDDRTYLKALADHLPKLMDDARADLIFYLAGVDTHKSDPYAHFKMTAEGIVERDRYVVEQARMRNIPVVYLTGGGFWIGAWEVQYRSIADLLERFADLKPRSGDVDPEPPSP